MELAGRRVLVAGTGVSGVSVIRALSTMDANVVVTVTDPEALRPSELDDFDLEFIPGLTTPPEDTALVVTSPGWRPTTPLLQAAKEACIEVIGDVELAWRLGQRQAEPPTWLCVTGTNGKTTTVGMTEAILRAAGVDAVACGNVGFAALDAVLAGHRVLAVELSSFQLYWSNSLTPKASVVLNLAEDHLDWHGSMERYAAAKGKVYRNCEVAVANLDDEWSMRLARDYASGQAKRVSFGLDTPRVNELGVVEDLLVDRAFVADPVQHAEEIATLADIRPRGPHNVSNALAAAALTRAYGVSTEAVAQGLRDYQPGAHRAVEVAEVGGVKYINDSKATNPHAAASSLRANESVVWIAGGQLKGASVDELVISIGARLRGVVLLGVDSPVIADALARHAPDVPVELLSSGDDEPMTAAVRAASAMAAPGDVVLLAPAAASLDMFGNYGQRGDAFAAAVRILAVAGELHDDGG
jgi:UDP-N-acetylmuramoylalanine--D-glutamate ligase